MQNNLKRKIYLLIAVLGVIVFPLILLIISNRFQYVNFEYATSTIFTQILALPMLKNAIIFSGLTIATIALAVFSMTFLFEITISKDVKKIIENKWYWKILKQLLIEEKHGWHIFLGYFIAILALNSLVTPIFMDVQSKLQPITLYQSYVATAFLGSIVILLARLLSKFPLQIGGISIGTFIILIYILAAISIIIFI